MREPGLVEKVRKRSRAIKDDQLETVLGGLTASQLRGVGTALRATFHGASKESLQEAILDSARPVKAILEECYKAELYHSQKHLFLARFTGKMNQPKPPKTFPAKAHKVIGALKFLYEDTTASLRSMLFEHKIDTYELLPLEGQKDTFKRTHSQIRHPIAVHVNDKKKIVQFCYPGFNQGKIASRERVEYSDLIQEMLRVISEEFGITTHILNIRESLSKLSMASDRRVIVNRTSPRTAKGEMDLRGYLKQNSSAADVLTNLLAPYLTLEKDVLSLGIEEALKNALSETEIATWKKENITTRITYWPHGAEILFVWHGSHPTITLIDELLDLILSAEQVSHSKEDSDLWNELLKMPSEQIFTLGQAVQAWNTDQKHCRKVIELGIKASVIQPVFRIKSDRILLESANEWTNDLSSLSAVFTNDHGKVIDGSEPKNVEIAFLKLGGTRTDN